MIRTAILAGILLVMLSMAYSRPGAFPSLGDVVAPVVEAEQEVAPLGPVHQASPHVETPRAVAADTPKHEEPAPAEEQADLAPVPQEEPQVAEVAPPAVTLAPAAMIAEPHPAKQAEIGRPVSLLPEPQVPAAPAREVARLGPLVSDDMPPPPAPTLPPAQEVKAVPVPAAELPEVNVPTRPVMAPQDFASRLTPDGNLAAPVAVPAPAPAIAEPRAPVMASAPKFMTPEERSRELYRLAREMEDTFIQKMTQ